MGLLVDLIASKLRKGPPLCEEDYQRQRLAKRQILLARVNRATPFVATALVVVGYLWLLLLPLEQLGRSTFIDENAIQPGMATTSFGWDSVHIADRYLDELTALVERNASQHDISLYLSSQFSHLGLATGTQNYSFATSLDRGHAREGTNVWATIVPPRTSATEAIVIAASWESLAFVGEFKEGVEGVNLIGQGKVRKGDRARMKNLRGAAMVLSLAEYLRGTNHYAKSLVFVISDHHLDGMQAFLSAYHGTEQKNLQADELVGLHTGVIWTALCIDYPGHSFSHLGLYFEGNNGRLPNQDLLNTISDIAQYRVSLPVRLYQTPSELEPVTAAFLPASLAALVERLGRLESVQRYWRAARGLAQHWSWAGLGRSSGVHGVFLQYRIDAITLFALPARGPHGFHSFGRLLEGSLRAVNNLLERLHASLFFYLYLRPGWFTKVGSYLPAATLIGSGITIRGLGRWRVAGEGGRKRPVLAAAVIALGSHLVGGLVFWVLTRSGWFARTLSSQIFRPTSYLLPLLPTVLGFAALDTADELPTTPPGPSTPPPPPPDNLPITLSALTHLTAGAIIPTLSMLNFPQATLLATLLLPPLLICSAPLRPVDPTKRKNGPLVQMKKLAATLLLCTANPIGVASVLSFVLPGRAEAVRAGIIALVEEWEILGNWCWVGVWVIWWPLWVQVLISSL